MLCRMGSGAPRSSLWAPGEKSPTVRGTCTRTSALSSGEWPPSRGLLSAASGPSWYFLLLTGAGSKSLPGPRQSPAWWLSPFCSWGGGEDQAWEGARPPTPPSPGPQEGLSRCSQPRFTDPHGGAPEPRGRGSCRQPGGRERRGGDRRGSDHPKRPPAHTKRWVTVGGPEPCPHSGSPWLSTTEPSVHWRDWRLRDVRPLLLGHTAPTLAGTEWPQGPQICLGFVKPPLLHP